MDEEGRFLHDFSYAGYHMGEVNIPPDPPGAVIDVTQAPYHADKTGVFDATAAIQAAIDDSSADGGGIVYLPPGTYRIRPPLDKAQVAPIGRVSRPPFQRLSPRPNIRRVWETVQSSGVSGMPTILPDGGRGRLAGCGPRRGQNRIERNAYEAIV